jgi:hypothetical protein
MTDHFRRRAVRKLVLAAIAALAIAAPSIADAQQRSESQDRPPRASQQDTRRGGGFQGMLRNIAGARLGRAHAERGNQPAPNDKNQKKR